MTRFISRAFEESAALAVPPVVVTPKVKSAWFGVVETAPLPFTVINRGAAASAAGAASAATAAKTAMSFIGITVPDTPPARRASQAIWYSSGVDSPPANVRQLHADERELQTATGARLVAVARGRQLLIRALGKDGRAAAAVVRLAPGEHDDVAARQDLEALSAQSPPQVGGVTVGPAPPADDLLR